MKTLTTARLVLRSATKEDFPAIALMNSDPQVMRYLALNSAVPTYERALEQAPEFLGLPCPKDCGIWVITSRQAANFVGCVWLGYIDDCSDIELGYRLATEYWGKGYATEAGQRVADHAFREAPIGHLVAVICPQNLASVRVAEKIGFERSGIVAGCSIVLDRYVLSRDQYLEQFVDHQ